MSTIKIDIRKINEQLSNLVEKEEDITLEQIPEVIRDEFFRYIAGRTTYKKNNEIRIYYQDFLQWIKLKYE